MKLIKETLFAPYRPYCAALASQPSQNVLSKLQDIVDNEESDEVLQILQDYLVFPNQVYLRNPSCPENYTIATLDFLTNLLKRINVDSAFLFKDLLAILMKLELKSDDCKLAVANCVYQLFRSSMLNQVVPFEEENHKYELSHVVFTLLTFMEETEDNALMLGALSAMNMILDVYSDKNLLEPMVPGLLSKLVKLLKNDRVKSRGQSEIINLWTRVFSEIFLSDFRVDDVKSLNHVSTHLSEILPYTYSTNAKVRESACNIFHHIKSIDYFLKDAVEYAASILSRNVQISIKELLSERNQSSIQKHVFTEIHSMTEVFSDVEIYRLYGFLRLLQLLKNSYQFFKSESYKKPLLHTLLRLGRVELNRKVSYIYVKSEAVHFGYSLSDIESLFEKLEDPRLPQKEYVYLKYDEIGVYNNICEILSNSSAIDDITQYVLEELLQSKEDQRKRDCLSLIPKIIHPSMNSFIFEEFADTLLQYEDFYDEICECLVILITSSPEVIRNNYMSDVLSFILTKTLDRGLIAFALNEFAKNEGFVSIFEFLNSYSRPLSQTLFIHLRQLQSEDVPLVLLSIVLKLKNNSSELRDVFLILLSQLDISWLSSDKTFTTKILQIIKTSIESIEFVERKEEEVIESQLELKRKSNYEAGALTQLVKSLMIEDLANQQFMEEEEPSDNHSNDPNDPEGEVKISLEQSYLRKCILHTRHFVSMVRCPRWQILSMEIILLSIQVATLRDDELLPLVHQIWQPLKLLFESDNIFVVDRAFTLLNILAQTSKDFIRKRSEQDVFPHIMKYITKLRSLKTSTKESSSLLIVKQADKLLEKMLRGLWSFTALLDLDEKSVGKLISSIGELEIMDLSPLRETDEDILHYYRVLKENMRS